jgi:hypothetical protein
MTNKYRVKKFRSRPIDCYRLQMLKAVHSVSMASAVRAGIALVCKKMEIPDPADYVDENK